MTSRADGDSAETDHNEPVKWWSVLDVVERGAIVVAIAGLAYSFIWNGSWFVCGTAAAVALAIEVSYQSRVAYLRIQGWRLRRGLARSRALLREQQAELRELLRDRELLRQGTHQTRMLTSQLRTELAQKEAHLSTLRRERLEMERLMLQRELEKEARAARKRLDLACAAIEADRLEAAAWRMEVTAKNLEIKLNQADLLESLSAIENNAQDRIIAAYEQGIDHGKRGVIIPHKFLRHLRVVEESA